VHGGYFKIPGFVLADNVITGRRVNDPGHSRAEQAGLDCVIIWRITLEAAESFTPDLREVDVLA
jgi:hypothetical protein